MATGTLDLETPMAVDEKPKTLSVKLHTDVIEAARIVGAYRNESMTDMLSDILRPILAKMEQEEVSKRTKPARSKGGPK
jgi:hypothetical protein